MLARLLLIGLALLTLFWFNKVPLLEPESPGFFEEVVGRITSDNGFTAEERNVELWATSDHYMADGLIVRIPNTVIRGMVSKDTFCRDNNYGWNHAYDDPHEDGDCFHPPGTVYVYYGSFKIRVLDDGVWRYAPREFSYDPHVSQGRPATNPPGDVIVDYDVDNNTFTRYDQLDPITPNVAFEFHAPLDYADIGSVTYGYRWFGTVYVDDDFTIPSGKRVTVNPGTTILVAVGKRIIVDGTFEILGTPSDPVLVDRQGSSGTWGGIVFNSGSTGTIDYATIRHATKGIFVSSASPTLQNNTIEHFTEQGIYLYNALTGANDPPVQNNTIRHGGSAGIYVTGTTPPQARIANNTIDDVYVGIDFEGGNFDDLATIEGNFIGQNSGGSGQSIQTALKLNTGATVEVKDNYLENGYDENLRDVGSSLANIHNNALFYGLIGYHAADYTSAGLADNYIAGNSAGAYISYWDATPNSDGGNNFENDDYNLSSESVWLIDAENNWWGSTNSSVIESKLEGNIDYQPYLSSPNPNAGPPGLSLSKGTAGLVRATERMMEFGRGIEQFALLPNHPNPFNPSTMIEFELPEAAEVRVVVVDLSGRPVRELTRGLFDPGRYTIDWDGRDRSGASVASGVYFYRLVAVPVGGGSTFVQTRKFTLLK